MKRNKERGAALFLVLLFSGLSIAVLVGLNSTIRNSIDASSSRQFKRTFNQFATDINSLLNNPQTCSQTLNGIILDSLTVNSKTKNISLGEHLGYDASVERNFKLPNEGFRIFDIGLHLGPDRQQVSSGRRSGGIPVGLGTVQLGSGTSIYYTAYNAKLYLSAKKCGVNNTNCSESTKYITNEVQNFANTSKYQQIELVLFLDASRRIQTCYGRDSLGTACEYNGGVWNINETNPKYRCNPYRVCFVEKVGGTSIRSAPNMSSARCNDQRYSPKIVGMLNGEVRYFCNWCNVNPYKPKP